MNINTIIFIDKVTFAHYDKKEDVTEFNLVTGDSVYAKGNVEFDLDKKVISCELKEDEE